MAKSPDDRPMKKTGIAVLPQGPDAVSERAWRRSSGQAWMITFSDLVALMLAFFVLLFSMSHIEQKKWQGLVDSLRTNLNTLERVETREPAVEYQPEEEALIPGADLDYLAPVLREQIARHPLLARAELRLQDDRLIVSLPAAGLFRGRAAALMPQARDLAFALGGMLRNLTNRVEIEVRVAASDAAAKRSPHWRLALARAALVTDLVTRAGYRGPIVSRGVVRDTGSGSDRLDIVIHELAQEPL